MFSLLSFAFRHPFALACGCIGLTLFGFAISPPVIPDWEAKILLVTPLAIGIALLLWLLVNRMRFSARIEKLLQQAEETCQTPERYPSSFPFTLGRHGEAPLPDEPDALLLERLRHHLKQAAEANREGALSRLERELHAAYRICQTFSGFRDALASTLSLPLARALRCLYARSHDFGGFWQNLHRARSHRTRLSLLAEFRKQS